jgi:hypothetical protein
MSSTTPADLPLEPTATAIDGRRPLRFRFPILVLTVIWVFVLSTYELELPMLYRFLSRFGALALLLLTMLGW